MAELALPLLLVIPAAGLFGLLAAWGAPRAQVALAFTAAVLDLALAAALWAMGDAAGSHAAGGWPAPYGIELRADGLSRVMLLASGVVMVAATAYHLGRVVHPAGRADPPARTAPAAPAATNLAWPLLLLALNGLFLTTDFFNFYVFFELVAVSSYLLVGMGAHHPVEAAWKYSAQSVLGSIFLLVGVALLYGATGTLAMDEAALRLAAPATWLAPFFLTAFFLKAAVFPFHWWQPDAHAAAPTAGSMVLAGALINVGLYGVLRFWPLVGGAAPAAAVLAVGGASIAFGAIAAWRQADAKRLLGFSSVSQLGFVLVAIGWGTAGALAAALFFMIGHALAKVLLFAATGSLTERAGTTRLAELAGHGHGAVLLGGAYLIGACSLVGLPPAIGFAGKVGLVTEGARSGAWPWLALIAAGSAMTLVYAFRAYQTLFWAPRPAALAASRAPEAPAVVLVLAALVVAGGVAAAPTWRACQAVGAELAARPMAGALRAGAGRAGDAP